MAFGADLVNLVPAGTLAGASGNGTTVDLSGYSAGVICINVTVATSTPSILPAFNWSDDGITFSAIGLATIALLGATTAGAITAITSVSQSWYQFLPANLALPRKFRVSWSGGTGTVNFGANAYMRRG